MPDTVPIKGRGTSTNPTPRFDTLQVEAFEEDLPEEPRRIRTEFYKDDTRSIITYNQSPDVGFDASINPYRGCEHGCVYCYARPFHEYLGFSPGLDFESKIVIKQDAPVLLRKELATPSWEPQVIGISGVTDPYQPVERSTGLTRKCLETLLDFRNPAVLITKNYRVTRDIDLLSQMAGLNTVAVFLSVTTLDRTLCRTMEPRTSSPDQRLKAIKELTQAGIPAGVLVAPVIPGLTDHEMLPILSAAAEAGATVAGYIVLRLPYAVSELFEHWLEEHVPLKKSKVLDFIKSMRDGKLNDASFKSRMRGKGFYAEQIAGMFKVACKKTGLGHRESFNLTTRHFRNPDDRQLSLL